MRHFLRHAFAPARAYQPNCSAIPGGCVQRLRQPPETSSSAPSPISWCSSSVNARTMSDLPATSIEKEKKRYVTESRTVQL